MNKQKTRYRLLKENRDNEVVKMYVYYKSTQPLASKAAIRKQIAEKSGITEMTVYNILKGEGVL